MTYVKKQKHDNSKDEEIFNKKITDTEKKIQSI